MKKMYFVNTLNDVQTKIGHKFNVSNFDFSSKNDLTKNMLCNYYY